MKECNQCGKCCVNYSDGGLSALTSEIEYWEVFRPEISRYVSDGRIWMSPTTGEQLKRCPWLRQVENEEKYTCDIYHDRPDDCKHYPVTIDQMVQDECEMIEVSDLSQPEKAQKTLDRIMVDSRPPVL
ncbi:MAG: YkgJ family cysteine cluster protein [Pseudomonadales bacterium]|nr:YkgJ family cysteine cluster protein [Pseudomonadales bacterium]